jgi:hypothetical protein
MARNTATLDGSCENLAVYSIPYKEAPAPQVVIQQPPAVTVQQPPAAPGVSVAASGGGSSYHEHEDEHEGHDD